MTKAKRRWLITGCSTGFGRVLAERVIGQRDHVFATARDPEALSGLVHGQPNAEALRPDASVGGYVGNPARRIKPPPNSR
ncbi:hypothetical protein AB4Y44_28980 [Paraburkholderia sp. BR10937]|uniref:hypothetical protein n=1 Tax=Paraburkholderia sp. BR10937 TaxID=3236994 RepID=UPI0034D1E913